MIPLFQRPHDEARALLRTGTPVFLPINPVEYHGPHLSLHNDGLLAAGLMRDTHARLALRQPNWPLLVAPELEIGVDPVPGPGSRPVPFAMARDLICGACRALVELGAQAVILLTFHGAPMHNLAIEGGLKWLTRHGVRAVAPMNRLMEELMTANGAAYAGAYAPLPIAGIRDAMMRGFSEDLHAGYIETSLALHYAPESVAPRYLSLPPCQPLRLARPLIAVARLAEAAGQRRLAAELRFIAIGHAWYRLRPFPGYSGRPHLASAEAGRYLGGRIADFWAELIIDVLTGRARSPAPILPWLTALTLNGRMGL